LKHKTAIKIAIFMIIVFGAITILYPRLYAPKPASAPGAPVAEPPPTGP
jgi:hypothetical protein